MREHALIREPKVGVSLARFWVALRDVKTSNADEEEPEVSRRVSTRVKTQTTNLGFMDPEEMSLSQSQESNVSFPSSAPISVSGVYTEEQAPAPDLPVEDYTVQLAFAVLNHILLYTQDSLLDTLVEIRQRERWILNINSKRITAIDDGGLSLHCMCFFHFAITVPQVEDVENGETPVKRFVPQRRIGWILQMHLRGRLLAGIATVKTVTLPLPQIENTSRLKLVVPVEQKVLVTHQEIMATFPVITVCTWAVDECIVFLREHATNGEELMVLRVIEWLAAAQRNDTGRIQRAIWTIDPGRFRREMRDGHAHGDHGQAIQGPDGGSNAGGN
ncbi:hypothetical protein FOXB_00619 [Fusarium oxysporum f. sp. conglutinans Fo5176]|uniref:Uncharacterized protein n=1 Tax=Fusarium oxysporum (strain Fo5176) TaxID=660025 RepID=F9F2J5_FUSOF|nr:hypothetical protein FOXB_00619 [Fusarium oxysporum f. sp. conglutinans Fo5176]